MRFELENQKGYIESYASENYIYRIAFGFDGLGHFCQLVHIPDEIGITARIHYHAQDRQILLWCYVYYLYTIPEHISPQILGSFLGQEFTSYSYYRNSGWEVFRDRFRRGAKPGLYQMYLQGLLTKEGIRDRIKFLKRKIVPLRKPDLKYFLNMNELDYKAWLIANKDEPLR